jgi:hypothetical protein
MGAYSDKVSSAENQQERLIEFRGWVIGFVDGEGCFSIGFVRQPSRTNRSGYKTGYQVTHEFVVTQGERSLSCLHELHEFFGVGQVFINNRYDNHREHLHRYVVRKRADLLETVIPFFQRHKLRSSKRHDFETFVRCVDPRRCRLTQDAGLSHRDRRACSHDESTKTQARADQNPQRPYARHPGHWMKRWSLLHGDMQGMPIKGSWQSVRLRHVRIRQKAKFLVG